MSSTWSKEESLRCDAHHTNDSKQDLGLAITNPPTPPLKTNHENASGNVLEETMIDLQRTASVGVQTAVVPLPRKFVSKYGQSFQEYDQQIRKISFSQLCGIIRCTMGSAACLDVSVCTVHVSSTSPPSACLWQR
jgi:hypothetical protein